MRICKLDGCENSLERMHGITKFCCKKHQNRAWKRKHYIPKTRKFAACQFKGCTNPLAGMRSSTKYCCKVHWEKAWARSPAAKAYWQTSEYKLNHVVRQQKRNAQKAVIPATYTATDWKKTLQSFDHKCAYCATEGDLHQEHFIPFSKGGTYRPDNIIPACRSCNISKGARDPLDWCTPEQYQRVTEYFEYAKG